ASASAKHAPGTTIAALALATSWSEEGAALVAELDTAGGDLAARQGLPLDPGVVSLAAAARRGSADLELSAHTQRLGCGVEALLGPTAPNQARAAIAALMPCIRAALSDRTAFVDCGRWSEEPHGDT